MTVVNNANPRTLTQVDDSIVPAGGLQVTAIRVANAGTAGPVLLTDPITGSIIMKHSNLAANAVDDVHFDAIFFNGIYVTNLPIGAMVLVYCK